MPRRERQAFASEQDNRFSQAFSAALARQGLTLEQVVHRLEDAGRPVSQATLSYWQRGRALPTRESSLAAIAELERILRLPIGHLTSSLPSDAFSRWDHLDHMAVSDRVTALLDSLGIDRVADFATDYIHDDILVLEDDVTRRETSRDVIRALRDGVQRTAAIFGTNGAEDPLPMVTAGTGCQLGRVVDLGERGLIAVELLLDRTLTAGQPHLRSMTIEWLSRIARDDGDIQRVLPTSLPFMVFDASFLGTAPESCHYETTPYHYEPVAETRQPLSQELPPGAHLQVCLADPPPGWHCLKWSFGAEDEGREND